MNIQVRPAMPNAVRSVGDDMLEGKKNFKSPSANQVAKARAKVNLTAEEAARLLHILEADWKKWEDGKATMAPAFYELFLLKTGQKKLLVTKKLPQNKYSEWHRPSISEIHQARKAAHLTVDGAAKTVSVPKTMWQQWEDGHPMSPAIFDLFLIKTGQKSVDTSELCY